MMQRSKVLFTATTGVPGSSTFQGWKPTAAPRTAHEFARGFSRITKRDVLRLYKELMKAAMTVSNPKIRVATYDSIRYEFKARRHYSDEFAVLEAMTRGMSDLETLRDGRTHPFLYVNEDGIICPPLIEDRNVIFRDYVPGPMEILCWLALVVQFFIPMLIVLSTWADGRSALEGYAFSDFRHPYHKGLPMEFQGHAVPWKTAPPTGPEILDFRWRIHSLREHEAYLEEELMDLEAKMLAKGLALQEKYDAMTPQEKKKWERENPPLSEEEKTRIAASMYPDMSGPDVTAGRNNSLP